MPIDWVKANRLILEKAGEVIESAMEGLKERVEELSPVGDPPTWQRPYWPEGYEPGAFKASWVISRGSGRQEGSGLGEHSSSARIENWVIYNTQPYAERLEYGWSKQAPMGILRISLKEWGSILEAAGNKVSKL